MPVEEPSDSSSSGNAGRPLHRVARRRQRRIAAILSGAARELADSGYWAFSLEAVADRLDLSKTSLYHYFPSRDALVSAALEDLADRAIGQLETVAKQPGLGPRERLRTLIIAQLTLLLRGSPEATGLFARPREWPEEHRELIKALTRSHDRVFRTVVREGVEAGELTPVSIQIALQCMHGSINAIAAGCHEQRSPAALTTYVEEVADTILSLFAVSVRAA